MKRPEKKTRTEEALDESSLSAIFDECYAPIYRYIFYHISHVETAQDLAGEVFIRFLNQLKTGDSLPDDCRNWLFRVAHNLVIDEWRRMKHRDHLDLADDIATAEPAVEEQVENQLVFDRALRLLQDMPRNQASVIILRFLYSMPHSEIASILDLSVGAVKALQHRGLDHLRRRMSPTEKNKQPSTLACNNSNKT